jgi:hypothetical protein
VPVVVHSPAEAGAIPPAEYLPLSPDAGFRAVPLLLVLPDSGARLVAVGQAGILGRAGRPAEVIVVVRSLWQGDGPDGNAWAPIEEHAALTPLITAAVEATMRSSAGDGEEDATRQARQLAELSRNSVAELRSFRYELERLLGDTLRGRRRQELEPILAGIVELSAMFGRVGDEAREAAREGLWSWRTDPAAFHAHRHLADPTAVIDRRHRRGHRRSWFVSLDTAIRHCRQTELLAGQEAALTHSLLNAASTIAVTRDARAQENFNLIATVGALLLGLPALIVALYSANSVLPLTRHNAHVLYPVALAGLAASVVAAVLPGPRVRRALRFLLAAAATLLIVALLGYAGHLIAVQPQR